MRKEIVFLAMLAVLLVRNTVCFCLMARDKKAAREGKWRVKERTLFLSCALFGGLGGVLAMNRLHHKTRHWYFRVFFPVLLSLQCIALAVIVYLLLRG